MTEDKQEYCEECICPARATMSVACVAYATRSKPEDGDRDMALSQNDLKTLEDMIQKALAVQTSTAVGRLAEAVEKLMDRLPLPTMGVTVSPAADQGGITLTAGAQQPPVTKEPAAAEKAAEPTTDDVRAALRAKATRDGKDAAVMVLEAAGVSNVSELKPSQYADVIKYAELVGAAPGEVTLDDVRNALKALAAKKGNDAAKAILEGCQVEKVSELDPASYAEVMGTIKEAS